MMLRPNTNNTPIRSILLAKKLTGPNFTYWYRNLRIVLNDTIDKYYVSINLEQEVACLMLSRGWSVSKLLSLEDEKLPGQLESNGVQCPMNLVLQRRLKPPLVLAIREGKIQKDKKKKPQGANGKAKGKNKLAMSY
ncbi:hypothetical protein Tco_1094403 [Tanacetum coccineum]|uniref:Retrotransposon Copia-like N-terminal domain-containing protein n=1 Tax=Tanacetum coccineum TaxID=301880 RepID=A0ABQ5IFF3_9ASTR